MSSFLSKLKCDYIKYCSFKSSCCSDAVSIDVENNRKQTDSDIEVNTCCFSFKRTNHVHDDISNVS